LKASLRTRLLQARPLRGALYLPIDAASAAARCMLDDISLVTVLCSSTAAAVEVTYSLTFWIACRMELRAATTSPEMPFRVPFWGSVNPSPLGDGMQ